MWLGLNFIISTPFVRKKVQICSELDNYHYNDILAFAILGEFGGSLKFCFEASHVGFKEKPKPWKRAGQAEISITSGKLFKNSSFELRKSFCIGTMFLLLSLSSIQFLKNLSAKSVWYELKPWFLQDVLCSPPPIYGVDLYGMEWTLLSEGQETNTVFRNSRGVLSEIDWTKVKGEEWYYELD